MTFHFSSSDKESIKQSTQTVLAIVDVQGESSTATFFALYVSKHISCLIDHVKKLFLDPILQLDILFPNFHNYEDSLSVDVTLNHKFYI